MDIARKNQIHSEVKQEIEQLAIFIVKQNYFEMDSKFYHQSEGLAKGAPSSAFLAEIYLQYLEHNQILNLLIKHKILSYHRHVDGILITYNVLNTDINKTLSDFNSLHNKIQFSIENEANNPINFLDLTISRLHSNLQLGIFRKHTITDVKLHNTSCPPTEHKMSGINFLINRITTYPVADTNLNKEIQIIDHLLMSNDYQQFKAKELVHNRKQRMQKQTNNQTKEKWANFTYIGKETKFITKLFKDYNIGIAYCTRNTIENLLDRKNQN
jgi:hypothetical protein